jgi:isoleucyl-tRNA synthetase
MFKPVNSRVDFPEMEERILESWKTNNTFRRSIEARRGGPRYVLFDGPPTVNGSPAIHHILTSVFKDVLPRYKAMKGFYTPRIGGWDTHGLPVELEIEKKLGFSGKAQIEKYGVARFNEKCRESVKGYIKEFEQALERCGYWIDLEHPYVTMDNNYIESVWWIIKQLWDRGLVYQGYRVTPHCPRCGTSLSSHEVAQGYQENTVDPSVYIKFEVVDNIIAARKLDKSTYLLAWTTTPWTLPGNTALAVSPDAEYALIETGGDYFVMASSLLGVTIREPYDVVEKFEGKELVGLKYRPLYSPHDFGIDRLAFKDGGILKRQEPDKDLNYPVISGDFVTMEDGTGIVHIAPAYGEDDYDAGKEWELDFVQQVDLQGKVIGSYPFTGKFVKDADDDILDDLDRRGLLYRRETVKHTYPFCWRCESPLLYYAKETWYIKTTAVKDAMISGNKMISWYPEHIKYGRFGDWLENNIDWAFSRERYWGTPLPVWRCEACGSYDCIGGLEDLKSKEGFSGLKEPVDLHRPYIDEVTYRCPKCGGNMQRTPEVIDCWFDSGSMPFAQSHYPFENETLLEDGRFPADYICEAVDQTRGWFYSLHAISTLLFGRPCYKNVICLGHILDAKGEKMSKRKGNVVVPGDVMPKYGADALRWYLYVATAPGNTRQFDNKQLQDVSRRFLSTLWNVYSFFVLYANIDKYNPADESTAPDAELDLWILSELNQLIIDVETALENYSLIDACRKIESFVDGLSNWYVRRSRRRFWKSENDTDKLSAYNTLYECLVTLTKLIAPFTPFIAEEIYQNLVYSVAPEAPPSVHLADFPISDESKIDRELTEDNRLAMKVCSLGRAARSKAGIKIRQPLAELHVGVSSEREKRSLEKVVDLVLEELNIKELYCDKVDVVAAKEKDGFTVVSETTNNVAISRYITAELEAEGMAREIVHRVQNMRRNAGYEIADHINVYYEADAFIMQSLSSFADYVKQETLAREIDDTIPDDIDLKDTFKISGYTLLLGVKKTE